MSIVRLKGKALRVLVERIYERDGHCCVVCGKWVEPGQKPHHEPPGAGRKSDEIDKMALLCYECHFKRHHGKECREIKRKVEDYLHEIYH